MLIQMTSHDIKTIPYSCRMPPCTSVHHKRRFQIVLQGSYPETISASSTALSPSTTTSRPLSLFAQILYGVLCRFSIASIALLHGVGVSIPHLDITAYRLVVFGLFVFLFLFSWTWFFANETRFPMCAFAISLWHLDF